MAFEFVNSNRCSIRKWLLVSELYYLVVRQSGCFSVGSLNSENAIGDCEAPESRVS
jgi:hypothetical protein